MTRKEEIIQASVDHSGSVNPDFIKGALWADEHPDPMYLRFKKVREEQPETKELLGIGWG